MKRTSLYILTVLTLSSCGIYRKYERPETVVPDSTLYTAAVSDTTSIADISWEEFFTDPLLQDLIRKAVDSNTDLQTARLNVEQANENLKTARLSYIPSFNFAPEGSVGAFNSSFLKGGFSTPASWNYTVPVAASWEIDIFGKKTNRKRMAKGSLEMAQDYERAVMTGLVSAVATQYYTLLMLDEQMEYTRQTAEKFALAVNVLKEMMAAGMANQVAVSQMEGAYYETSAAVESIAQSITELENALSLLLNEPSHRIIRGHYEDSTFPEELKTGVPMQLLSRRPDVMAAEHSLAASYYGVNAARAAQYPSLTLSGSLGWTNVLGETVMNPGGLILGAAASLLQPIFNSGSLRAEVNISKSKMKQAELTLIHSLLNAGAEVNDALSLFGSATIKNQLRQKQIESLSAALENTEDLMRYTSTTYLEVLTAQQSLLSAQTSYSSDRLEKVTAVINLYRALGGGY